MHFFQTAITALKNIVISQPPESLNNFKVKNIYIDKIHFYYRLYFVLKYNYRHRRTPNVVNRVFELFNLNTHLCFNIIFCQFSLD